MYQFDTKNKALTDAGNTKGKSIMEIVNDHKDDPILDGLGGTEISVNKDDSVYKVRAEAGWPNHTGNTTDGLIINYLKDSPRYKDLFDKKSGKATRAAKIKVPTYKQYLDNRKDIGGTALIIYGHGKSSPVADNDLGTTLRDNANEKKNRLEKSGNYDAVIVKECFTESEFLKAVNNKYDSGLISRLEVFTHGSDNSIILGDRYDKDDKAYDKLEDEKGNYRNDDAAKDRRLFSKSAGEISGINKKNFSNDCRVILWGCRQAGGDEKKAKNYESVPITKSFAQGLANHLNVPVQAFYNTSRAPEKEVDGKMKTYVDGRMAPEKNAKEVMVVPNGK